MNRCNSAHHREHDDYCGNSAKQPDDQPDSTEQFPGDHKKGQSRRKVQMFGERAHAAGKTGSAIPSQHFLSAVGKEYDSQYDRASPRPSQREYLLDSRSSVILHCGGGFAEPCETLFNPMHTRSASLLIPSCRSPLPSVASWHVFLGFRRRLNPFFVARL